MTATNNLTAEALTEMKIDALCQIFPSSQRSRFATKKGRRQAEISRQIEWDGVQLCYVPAKPGRLVKSAAGSWGRERGDGTVAALTAAECEKENLTPGPANF